ncbi:MAG TPA: M20/M25/M40 family metallo-hydrolase [Crocinitomix sp.]|nr:M20/M25/M40 family metallo-hydrolase [Crocinitomix sp.]
MTNRLKSVVLVISLITAIVIFSSVQLKLSYNNKLTCKLNIDDKTQDTPNIDTKNDSLFIAKIYSEALVKGKSYIILKELCKKIGARITGSAEAEMAIYWAEKVLKSYGFDKVYLQKIKVPHWERGTKEVAWAINSKSEILKLDVLALGGSIGTNGILEGELIEFNTLSDLKQANPKKVKNKIVFINQPFDQSLLQTFKAYGACYPIRGYGAVEASKKGAIAVIIRSLATPIDHYPHTGVMSYNDEVEKIPAAAISTSHSNQLSNWLKKGKVTLKIEMDCKMLNNIDSYNVIAEMTGNKDNNIITFGGHLDSWDVGEGAHDDGAGITHSIEALRLLKVIGYRPNHTLRLVLFMNEENGNMGGKTYAKLCKEKGEKHICAIESDRGGFLPIGFDIVGNDKQLAFIKSFKELLYIFQLYKFDKGYGGVDINPLREYYPNMLQLGMAISSQRYFNYHHTEADVFETVNKRELELGSAAMATMLYLVDKYID